MAEGPVAAPPIVACETIEGVFSVALPSHSDPRGELVEMFRASWLPTAPPRQWNLVRSLANTLRGIHVHLRHTDYVLPLDGSTLVGLKDLRRDSRTYLKDAHYRLEPSRPLLLHIPPGVGHGFYAPDGSLLGIAVTRYFDPEDDLGYRWDDPAALLFPDVRSPILSERDARAPDFHELLARLEPHQHGF